MIRAAIRSNPRRAAVSRSISTEFPVGGLNARDSVASMPGEDAISLDNVFPERTWGELRRGFSAHVTGITGPVESLLTWNGANAKMFAAAGGKIYDVSTAGAVGAAAVTGLTNSRWQSINFVNTGNLFLVCVNGADGVRTFDGTTWATQAITGATASTFACVSSWKRRLWFGQASSTKVWYLGTDAIAGAATALDLGGVWRMGGQIAGILATSFDSAGTGVAEYIGFVSTLGEVAVYQGSDPASTSTFGLVGVFRLGPPVGRRFFAQLGGDMAMITSDGVVSLMQSMQIDRSAAVKFAVTDKINRLFAESFNEYRSTFGWDIIAYPKGHRLIVNIPQSGIPSIQYVMNTLSGAWCRYTGHDAQCWGLLNEDIYFAGAAGTIFRADTGATDDGAGIPYLVRKAFIDFGTRHLKRFVRVRPLITSNGSPAPTMAVDVDYEQQQVANPTLASPAGAVWDTGVWDADVWAGGPEIYRQWAGVSGVGYVGSLRMDGIAKGLDMTINAFDVVFEPAPNVSP